MRVVLEAGALEVAHRSSLSAILDHAVDGRHVVLVDPDAEQAWEAVLLTQDPVLQVAWRTALEDSLCREATAPAEIVFSVADVAASDWSTSPPRLNPADAKALLRDKLRVMVEDETSDGLFLDRVVPPALASSWERARKNAQVEFVTAGGVGNVPRRLAATTAKSRSMRTFVLIDSDAKRPWWSCPADSTNPRSLDQVTRRAFFAATRLGIPCFILRRRMAENYLPPGALEAWCAQLPPSERTLKQLHIETFGRLGQQQRHHHHLKDGYVGEKNDPRLFTDVPEDQRLRLAHPLGSSTYEAFTHATPESLHDDGVHDELAPLFQQLLRRI